MRDVESLCEEAGLGRVSRSTASRTCKELRDRFRAFMARELSGDPARGAVLRRHLPAGPPSGAKEGVLCAWGFTEQGERVLLSVCLGMREAEDDWLSLGRDLTARGLRAPLLIVADAGTRARERAALAPLEPPALHRLRKMCWRICPSESASALAYWRALDEGPTSATALGGCGR